MLGTVERGDAGHLQEGDALKMSDKEKENAVIQEPQNLWSRTGAGIALGTAVGAILGQVLFDHMGMGIGLGISVGASIGALLEPIRR